MHAFYQMFEKWKISSDSATALVKEQPENAEAINRDMSMKFQRFQGETKSFIARNANSPALYAAIPAIDVNGDFPTYEAVCTQLFNCFSQSEDIARLQKEYDAIKLQRMANDKFAVGKEAPDFTEKKPDGTDLSLSDLRGNVVLLDFWASWCGPCRRANPHVVQLYNKYKDQGFTVMSVSLDKDRAAWLQAIEKDNLSWPNHVSDLQYWSAKAAQLYGVKGIPFTMLIDKEGKIIRKNPNPQELDAELTRIFGN
jgi:thiol-disulfide isomerase/thioredoxin